MSDKNYILVDRFVATDYKFIELNSVANYDLVDRLLANGWKVERSYMFSVLLARKKA